MSQYDHVEDAVIRSVLQGDISEDALCYALSETLRHAVEDQFNPEIPYTVSEQRLALAYDAADWWNNEGNAFQSVECLRQCWGV